MEWYVDELVVPLSDRLPSPESWMQWGISATDSFGMPDKYFVTEVKPVGERNGKSMSDELDMDFFTCERDNSSTSSVSGSLSEASVHRKMLSRDWLDHRCDEFAGINEMDDIFMNSLLEDPPSEENFHGLFCFPSRPQRAKSQEDDLFAGSMSDSQSISSNLHGTRNSKFLKTHTFSLSTGWENSKTTTTHFLPCNLGQEDFPSVEPPVENVAVPSEESSANGPVSDKTSVEESILQDLETVMAQMTEKTRLCFRDALYRLSKKSEQCMVDQSQDEDSGFEESPESVDHHETLRAGGKKTSESETNNIDRTVANLMFSKMQFNAQQLPAATLKLEQEAIPTVEPCNYSSKQSQLAHCDQLATFPGDAEVPIFGQKTA